MRVDDYASERRQRLGDRGCSFNNYYGSSTQDINSITTGSGPANIAQHQTIHQTIGKEN